MVMESQRLATKSPIHVHVARNTPVHVHVKKIKKKQGQLVGIPSAVEQRISYRNSSGLGSSLSSGISGKKSGKNKPRSTPTFIPPPGRASSGRSISWEGPSHRLEINQPELSGKRKGALKVSDLSTSEEEDIAGKENMYESKINTLLDEVGTLRNEVALQKSNRVVEKKSEQLNASRKILEDQEDELLDYKSELDTTIRENEKLRHSVDKYKDIMEASRSEVEHIESEKDLLLRKLIEVEVDGKAASEETSKLRDTVRRLKNDKKLTVSDVSALAHQREVLMQKLEGFEKTNRTLRKLLKQAHFSEEQSHHLTEQRDVLLRKLTEAETQLEEVSAKFSERDMQVDTLLTQVEADKEQVRTFAELQRTMEATRGHLQNQLRSKDGENSRISLQFREIEKELNRRIMEVEHLEGLLASTRDKSSKEKEALKKATRIQRDRASKNDNTVGALKNDLSDKTEQVEAFAAELDAFKDKYNRQYREKAASDAKLVELHGQMNNLEQVMYSMDIAGSAKGSTDSLASILQSRLQELKAYKHESGNLKDQVRALSEKLKKAEKSALSQTSTSQAEIVKLQSAVHQYETLITEFKSQIEKYRKENEELSDRVYQKEKDLKKQLHQNSSENEKTVNRLEKRLSELEPYPELLKTAEIRLQDAQERVNSHERRTTDHTRLIAELTQKVDSQAEQLERVREKYHGKQDDVKQLQSRLETTERKFEDADAQRREFISVVSKREDSVHVLQERLDEQRHDNTRLMQQLETALADARRQADIQKEKSLSKERTAQARILDLESQLSRSTATTQQIKRGKDEAERKFNSRLQDMRDRLEQANTTTRSMQSYVSFLKSTYASVFSDAPDSPVSSPRPY